MRVDISLDDTPEGVALTLETHGAAELDENGYPCASLAGMTATNLMLHLRHLKETTGLRLEVRSSQTA